MAPWNWHLNNPPFGEWYIITVEKPAGFVRVGLNPTGSGTTHDPWRLHYRSAPGAPASSDEWRIGVRRGPPPYTTQIFLMADDKVVNVMQVVLELGDDS